MAHSEQIKNAELAQMQEALRAMEASQKAQAETIAHEREEARAAAQDLIRGEREMAMKSQTLLVEEAKARIARTETEGARALQEEKARIEGLMKAAAATRTAGPPVTAPVPVTAGTTTVTAPTRTQQQTASGNPQLTPQPGGDIRCFSCMKGRVADCRSCSRPRCNDHYDHFLKRCYLCKEKAQQLERQMREMALEDD